MDHYASTRGGTEQARTESQLLEIAQDHDIVFVEYDIKAKRIQQAPDLPLQTSRLGDLRDHLVRYRDTFLSSSHSHLSVSGMWVSFNPEVIAAIEKFIPTKMAKTKYR